MRALKRWQPNGRADSYLIPSGPSTFLGRASDSYLEVQLFHTYISDRNLILSYILNGESLGEFQSCHQANFSPYTPRLLYSLFLSLRLPSQKRDFSLAVGLMRVGIDRLLWGMSERKAAHLFSFLPGTLQCGASFLPATMWYINAMWIIQYNGYFIMEGFKVYRPPAGSNPQYAAIYAVLSEWDGRRATIWIKIPIWLTPRIYMTLTPQEQRTGTIASRAPPFLLQLNRAQEPEPRKQSPESRGWTEPRNQGLNRAKEPGVEQSPNPPTKTATSTSLQGILLN